MRKRISYLLSALIALTLTFIACGGGGNKDKDVAVTGVSLNKPALTLAVGGTEQLKATVQPNNATNTKTSWASDKNNIAIVSDSGLVRGIDVGEAAITVKTNDGGYTKTCFVTVEAAVTPTPITVAVSPKTPTVTAGQTQQFTATVTGGTGNTNVTWSVVTANGGSITQGGLYTAPATAGAYTVRATSVEDADKQDIATVTVEAAVTPTPITVTVSPKTPTVTAGQTQQFTATVTGGSGNTNVTWTVVTANGGDITQGGLYIAPATAGTYTIRAASVEDADKRDEATVTVIDTPMPGIPDTSWYNSTSTTFTLNNADQLAGLAVLVNNGTNNFSDKTIYLGNNIDLLTYSGGEAWTPIGSYSSRPFSGTFNGNYKTISNLKINRTSNYIGLFAYVEYGTLQNLALTNASISGDQYVGGIAGRLSNSSVTNCYSTGAVSGSICVGGIAGSVTLQSSVTNCYSTCAISGSSWYLGGIAGGVFSSGVVENCYSTGAIGSSSPDPDPGGVAGYNGGSSIMGCAALNASVTGSGGGRVASSGGNGPLSNNIAWSGMLVNGSTVSGGAANNQNGADASAAAIQNGSAFNNMFTDSVWTKQPGYLPGLFGQAVPIPAHIN